MTEHIFQLPDGSQHVFDVPDAPVGSAPAQAPTDPTQTSLGHKVGVALSSIPRGVLNTLSFLGEGASAGDLSLANLHKTGAQEGASNAAFDQYLAPKIAGIGVQANPLNPAERYIEAGGESIGSLPFGGPLGPETSVARALMTAGASGIGGQAAAERFGDNPIMRIVGALAGGGGVNALRSVAKPFVAGNVRETVQDATRGMQNPEMEYAAAAKNIAADQAAGLPTTVSQAFENAPGLAQLQSAVVSGAPKTAEMLQKQPGIAAAKTQEAVESLPGKVGSPSDAAVEKITGQPALGAPIIEDKLFPVLSKGTLPSASVSPILTAARYYNGTAPGVFANTVKSWLAQKMTSATSTTGGGQVADTTLKNLYNSLYSNPAQRKGLKEALVGVAEGQGMPSDALYPGFLRLMDTVGRMANRPGNVSGTNVEKLQGIAGQNILATILRLFSGEKGQARFGEQHVQDLTYSKIDNILSSPNGVSMLKTLAANDPLGKQGQAAIQTFISGMAGGQANPQIQQITQQ